MKRLLTLAAALAFLVLAAGPRPARAADADPALLAAMDQLNQAFESEDRAAIERLVTPDHKAVGPIYPGAVGMAAQFASFPEVRYRATLLSGPTVEMLSPDVALVNLELAVDGTFRGQALPKRSYVTAIWVRVGGRWLQKLFQETAVRAD